MERAHSNTFIIVTEMHSLNPAWLVQVLFRDAAKKYAQNVVHICSHSLCSCRHVLVTRKGVKGLPCSLFPCRIMFIPQTLFFPALCKHCLFTHSCKMFGLVLLIKAVYCVTDHMLICVFDPLRYPTIHCYSLLRNTKGGTGCLGYGLIYFCQFCSGFSCAKVKWNDTGFRPRFYTVRLYGGILS